MFDDLSLSHEEQQAAVERIQELMKQGISTAQAIKIIAQEIREEKSKDSSDEQSWFLLFKFIYKALLKGFFCAQI